MRESNANDDPSSDCDASDLSDSNTGFTNIDAESSHTASDGDAISESEEG